MVTRGVVLVTLLVLLGNTWCFLGDTWFCLGNTCTPRDNVLTRDLRQITVYWIFGPTIALFVFSCMMKGAYSWLVVFVASPLGLLAASVLLANNIRDAGWLLLVELYLIITAILAITDNNNNKATQLHLANILKEFNDF